MQAADGVAIGSVDSAGQIHIVGVDIGGEHLIQTDLVVSGLDEAGFTDLRSQTTTDRQTDKCGVHVDELGVVPQIVLCSTFVATQSICQIQQILGPQRVVKVGNFVAETITVYVFDQGTGHVAAGIVTVGTKATVNTFMEDPFQHLLGLGQTVKGHSRIGDTGFFHTEVAVEVVSLCSIKHLEKHIVLGVGAQIFGSDLLSSHTLDCQDLILLQELDDIGVVGAGPEGIDSLGQSLRQNRVPDTADELTAAGTAVGECQLSGGPLGDIIGGIDVGQFVHQNGAGRAVLFIAGVEVSLGQILEHIGQRVLIQFTQTVHLAGHVVANVGVNNFHAVGIIFAGLITQTVVNAPVAGHIVKLDVDQILLAAVFTGKISREASVLIHAAFQEGSKVIGGEIVITFGAGDLPGVVDGINNVGVGAMDGHDIDTAVTAAIITQLVLITDTSGTGQIIKEPLIIDLLQVGNIQIRILHSGVLFVGCPGILGSIGLCIGTLFVSIDGRLSLAFCHGDPDLGLTDVGTFGNGSGDQHRAFRTGQRNQAGRRNSGNAGITGSIADSCAGGQADGSTGCAIGSQSQLDRACIGLQGSLFGSQLGIVDLAALNSHIQSLGQLFAHQFTGQGDGGRAAGNRCHGHAFHGDSVCIGRGQGIVVGICRSRSDLLQIEGLCVGIGQNQRQVNRFASNQSLLAGKLHIHRLGSCGAVQDDLAQPLSAIGSGDQIKIMDACFQIDGVAQAAFTISAHLSRGKVDIADVGIIDNNVAQNACIVDGLAQHFHLVPAIALYNKVQSHLFPSQTYIQVKAGGIAIDDIHAAIISIGPVDLNTVRLQSCLLHLQGTAIGEVKDHIVFFQFFGSHDLDGLGSGNSDAVHTGSCGDGNGAFCQTGDHTVFRDGSHIGIIHFPCNGIQIHICLTAGSLQTGSMNTQRAANTHKVYIGIQLDGGKVCFVSHGNDDTVGGDNAVHQHIGDHGGGTFTDTSHIAAALIDSNHRGIVALEVDRAGSGDIIFRVSGAIGIVGHFAGGFGAIGEGGSLEAIKIIVCAIVGCGGCHNGDGNGIQHAGSVIDRQFCVAQTIAGDQQVTVVFKLGLGDDGVIAFHSVGGAGDNSVKGQIGGAKIQFQGSALLDLHALQRDKVDSAQVDGAAAGAGAGAGTEVVIAHIDGDDIFTLVQFHSAEADIFNCIGICLECIVVIDQFPVDIDITGTAAGRASLSIRIAYTGYTRCNRLIEDRHIHMIQARSRCIDRQDQAGTVIVVSVQKAGKETKAVVIIGGIQEDSSACTGLLIGVVTFFDIPHALSIQIVLNLLECIILRGGGR